MADAETSADYVGPKLAPGSTLIEQLVIVRYLDERGRSTIAYHVEHDSSWDAIVGMLATTEHLVVLRDFGVIDGDGEPRG